MVTAGLAAGTLLWLAAGFLFVLRVGLAEADAQEADVHVGNRRPVEAALSLERAFARLPMNADYIFRAAQMRQLAGDEQLARTQMDRAIAVDPISPGYHAAREEMELAPGNAADANLVLHHFAEAIRLDPNNVARRIRHAELLERFNRPADAREQYAAALWYDDQLTRVEKKRLRPEKVQEIDQRIQRLSATTLPAAGG